MGDRVAVLLDGELQQVDTPTNVYDRPANLFVAGFIGSPPMNFVQATVERADGAPVVKVGETTVPLSGRGLDAWAGKEVIVGVRPEDVQGASRNGGGAGRITMRAKIERVEALGASLLGYFAVDAEGPKGGGVAAAVTDEALEDAPLTGHGGVLFCATFEPRAAVRIGDTVDVAIDRDRLHFFDPETEASIRG